MRLSYPLIFALVLCATSFAQHPDAIPLSRYGESLEPGMVKEWRHVRLSDKVDDTTNYTWYMFGKVGEADDMATVYGYQMRRTGVNLNYLFCVGDTALRKFARITETEDSDAVYEATAPIEQGRSWQYQLTDTVMARYTAVDEHVTVPAGTFDHCITVSFFDVGDDVTNTYAPDVGLILTVRQNTDFKNIYELTAKPHK